MNKIQKLIKLFSIAFLFCASLPGESNAVTLEECYLKAVKKEYFKCVDECEDNKDDKKCPPKCPAVLDNALENCKTSDLKK